LEGGSKEPAQGVSQAEGELTQRGRRTIGSKADLRRKVVQMGVFAQKKIRPGREKLPRGNLSRVRITYV